MNVKLYGEIATRVANLYAKKLGQQWMRDDMIQEAWVGMLTAKKFNGSNLRKYLWGAAANAIKQFTYRFRLPVRVHGHSDSATTLRRVSAEVLANVLDDMDIESIQDAKKRDERVRIAVSTVLGHRAFLALVIAGEYSAKDADVKYQDLRTAKRQLRKNKQLQKVWSNEFST